MTAILGTLPFLATLWLLVVLGAAALEESGAKIAAALKGKPAQTPTPLATVLRKRPRGSLAVMRPANLPLRAAA
jgi:hypothetical protein